MSWLDLDESTLVKVQENSVASVNEGFEQIKSGCYLVNINKAYLRKTDSGATMFELEVATKDDQKVYWSTCIRSGDAKGNSSTWTVTENHSEAVQKRYGVGTKVPLPGYEQLAQLFGAFGSSLKEHEPTEGKIEHRNETIDAKIFKTLNNKKFKACVRQYEDEYNGEISIKVDIEAFLNVDGLNSKGEDMETKFNNKIEKSPIKLMRKKKETVSAAESAAADASGW